LDILFSLFNALCIALFTGIGYYVGRRSKLEDIERISDILTKGIYTEEQPRNMRTKRTSWKPGNLFKPTESLNLDPIDPSEMERSPLKKGVRR